MSGFPNRRSPMSGQSSHGGHGSSFLPGNISSTYNHTTQGQSGQLPAYQGPYQSLNRQPGATNTSGTYGDLTANPSALYQDPHPSFPVQPAPNGYGYSASPQLPFAPSQPPLYQNRTRPPTYAEQAAFNRAHQGQVHRQPAQAGTFPRPQAASSTSPHGALSAVQYQAAYNNAYQAPVHPGAVQIPVRSELRDIPQPPEPYPDPAPYSITPGGYYQSVAQVANNQSSVVSLARTGSSATPCATVPSPALTDTKWAHEYGENDFTDDEEHSSLRSQASSPEPPSPPEKVSRRRDPNAPSRVSGRQPGNENVPVYKNYPAPAETVPADLTLHQAVNTYPNHIFGDLLDDLIRARWVPLEIVASMPADVRRDLRDRDVVQKNMWLYKRVQKRKAFVKESGDDWKRLWESPQRRGDGRPRGTKFGESRRAPKRVFTKKYGMEVVIDGEIVVPDRSKPFEEPAGVSWFRQAQSWVAPSGAISGAGAVGAMDRRRTFGEVAESDDEDDEARKKRRKTQPLKMSITESRDGDSGLLSEDADGESESIDLTRFSSIQSSRSRAEAPRSTRSSHQDHQRQETEDDEDDKNDEDTGPKKMGCGLGRTSRRAEEFRLYLDLGRREEGGRELSGVHGDF